MHGKLTGKTAMITGASRGIGAETARAFAKAGARVALLARSGGEIESLAQEIGDQAIALRGDVGRFADLEAAAQACVSRLGGLDILVNNAGVIEPIAPIAEADPEAWARIVQINTIGVFNGMRAVIPIMRKAGGGTVLTVGSGAAYNPLEGWSGYCTSKAGAWMLTRSADLEERANGLRILSLSPGTVATQMQRTIKSSGVNAVSQLDWSDHIPPEWPAQALLWMCGPEADRYLGQEVSLRDAAVRAEIGLS